MDNNTSIKEILEELGYQLSPDSNNSFRAKPLYRASENPTSLKINSDGTFIDFSCGIKGSIETLIRLTLGLKSTEEAQKWIANKNFRIEIAKNPIPKLKMAKTFPAEMLENLLPDHSYWENRGIPLEILKEFKGGLCRIKSRFQDYYVFPIWDSSKNIIGFAGRDTSGKKKISWRLVGSKGEWRYPLFINYLLIKKLSKVVITEGVGDLLSVYSAGIKNVMCLFGVEMSLSILNFLLKINPNKIIIALNNDKNNNNVGNEATEKLYKRLNKYFNAHQLCIKLPEKLKDWNLVLQEEGEESLKKQLLDV